MSQVTVIVAMVNEASLVSRLGLPVFVRLGRVVDSPWTPGGSEREPPNRGESSSQTLVSSSAAHTSHSDVLRV
jgi:hypothetical protein